MPTTIRSFLFFFILIAVLQVSVKAQTPQSPPIQPQAPTKDKSSDTAILKEIVVSGRKLAFQHMADRLVVNISSNRLFKTAANTYDILKNIPGLQVTGDGTLLLSGRITPTIFIDGKPSPMSPEELQNYLSSLSPDLIASIEIITNPSSKYDGEQKGIIDIKLKRDMTLGWRGNLSTNIQQNDYTLADNNFLLLYKTPKLTYTARLGYTTGTKIQFVYQGLQHLANTNIMKTNTTALGGNNNINYQLGVDYNFKKNQHIEIVGRAYQLNRTINTNNTLNTTDSSTKYLISNTQTRNHAGPTQDNYAVNLNYTGQFGKSQLEISGTLLKIKNRQKEDIQTQNTVTGDLEDYWKTSLKNDILIRTAQADLSRNAGKTKLSIGAKYAFTTTRNDLRYDTLNRINIFATDSSRTNNFQYDEYIAAGYASLERKIDKLSYSVSLRAEHTHSIANTITNDQVTERNYLTWLPSLDLTYTINENTQAHLSWSRRMTRPNFTQLNPFRFYNSPLNYYVGNPWLQPSTTNLISASFSQKVFNITFNFGRESDPMTRYPEYDSATNILQ